MVDGVAFAVRDSVQGIEFGEVHGPAAGRSIGDRFQPKDP